MPANVVAALARRSGASVEKVEKLWDMLKKEVVGAKLRSGAVIPDNPDNWDDEMWSYVVGAVKNALKIESKENKIQTVNSIKKECEMSVENLINRVLEGEDPSDVINDLHAINVSEDAKADFKKGSQAFNKTMQNIQKLFKLFVASAMPDPTNKHVFAMTSMWSALKNFEKTMTKELKSL